MSQECANCPKCHKTGLPILLTRYAIAPTYNDEIADLDTLDLAASKRLQSFLYQHGKDIPVLSGNFRVTDKEGGSEISLGDGTHTQYTLRLLRGGFVYVYNEKDPDEGKRLRCYEVSENGLLIETTPSVPPCTLGDERRDVACAPEKNMTTAYLLTIPHAEKAGEIWIGFSDAKWTPAVAEKHIKDAELRKKHMRLVDVSKWMGGTYAQQDHAANIHELDPKKPIIAEHLGRGFSRAFSFSPADFRTQVPGLLLEAVAKELNNIDGKKTFSIPPSDAELPKLKERWETYATSTPKGLTVEQIQIGNASPFERFIEEINRFYDRAHSGVKQNEKYKGKGMILALDDPAGITQDLNGLISWRQKIFTGGKKHKRATTVGTCIERIRTAVFDETRRNEAEKYEKKISQTKDGHTKYHAYAHGVQIIREMQPNEKEIYEELLEGDSDVVKIAFDKNWNENYLPRLKNKGKDYQDFSTNYTKSFENHKEKFVDPLAKAHVKWMESDRMAQYFICNFDPGLLGVSLDDDDSSEKGKEKEKKSTEAVKQSAFYVELFSRCVGRTPEQPVCADFYVKWLCEAPLDEKNLLWRALCLNQDSVSEGISKACTRIESVQEKIATLVRQQKQTTTPTDNAEPEEPKNWASTVALIRNWALGVWDAHTEVQEVLAKAFTTTDTKIRIAELKASRKLYREAKKAAENLEKTQKALSSQAMETSAKQSHTYLKSLAKAVKYRRIATSEEFTQLQAMVAKLERTPVSFYNNPTGRLIEQMKVPLARLYNVKNNPNFNKLRMLIGAIGDTPIINAALKGAPMEMFEATTSPALSNRAARRRAARETALPKTNLSARMPGTIDRRVLLENLLLDGRDPYFQLTYANMVAGDGLFQPHIMDKAGPNGNIWHYQLDDLERLALLTALKQKKEILDSQIAKARGEFKDLYAKSKEFSAQEKFIAEARAENARAIAAQEQELKRIEAEIEKHRMAAKESLTPVERQRRIAKSIAGGSWTVINMVIALWCYGSIAEELEHLGTRIGPNDDKYGQTADTVKASGLLVVASVTEVAHKALYAPVIGNWEWAAKLRVWMSFPVKVFGTVASSIASLYFAYWDWQKMVNAFGKGQTWWGVAYFAAFSLGIGSAFLGLLALFVGGIFITLAIVVALIYAVVSTVIGIFEPNENQKWLESCYFGEYKSKEFDLNWEVFEMSHFKRLGLANIKRLGLANS